MTDVMVSNETVSTFSRKTKDGRTLRYEMSIIQQPQRARACGAGAKSSADRRPVDPPPVVELRLFDGPHDITFQHNANFFLYTLLESARQIAAPKGSVGPTLTPVLTGNPVAGMAYLDRPCHAGYFIFPDLSVRHEGKYRLSFNLFEEVKLDADADAESETASRDHPNARLLQRSPSNPYQHVSFRLEVKSEPFSVFSAKKFPGLAESTGLSRLVAEQGCRVRIRRDVRIRVRKDAKSMKDDYPGDDTESHHEQFDTPLSIDQAAIDRSSSESNHINLSHIPPYAAIEAKSTCQDQQYTKPLSSYPHYPSHLGFGNSTQLYQPPPPPPLPPLPSSLSVAPVSTSYNARSQPHHSRQNSGSSSNDFHRQQQQYSVSSYSHSAQSSRENTGYSIAVDTKYLPQTQSFHTSATPSSTTTSTSNPILPPLSSLQPLLAASPASYEPPSTFPSHASTKGKRGYNSVFSGVSSAGPVQFGSRPEASGQELPMIETEEHGVISEDQLAQMKDMLEYRRADGTRKFMRVPKQSFSL